MISWQIISYINLVLKLTWGGGGCLFNFEPAMLLEWGHFNHPPPTVTQNLMKLLKFHSMLYIFHMCTLFAMKLLCPNVLVM